MAVTSFFKRNWIHFLAIGLFLLIGFIYFSQQLQGYSLKQHDIQEYIGMAHEATSYKEATGEEQLWSNSAFGGMPTAQTTMVHNGNLFAKITSRFLTAFPPPLGTILLYMICFYIMLTMMKINNWISIIGAICFAFLSYQIILVQAGHNSKGVAIAYMAPVIGAFFMAYRRNWIWGAILSAVFMSFEMAANHLQITYYLGFLLLGLGIVELIRTIREKSYLPFLKATAGVVVGYLVALAISYSNISITSEYADDTIRGGNDVTIAPDGRSSAANSTSGLDRDYVTQWSYGIGESFTLISPYIKGSSSTPLGSSPFADKIDDADVSPQAYEQVMSYPVYWGEQPITSGPVYLGVILMLLAILGVVYLKEPIKWALLAVSVLTLALSWGKNYMGLTDFFLDNVPGYNKFRAVTIILVMVELCIPLLAVLFLDKLIKERESIREKIKPFYYVTGGFIVFLFILKFVQIDKSYLSQEMDAKQRARQEEAIAGQVLKMDPAQLKAEYGIDVNNKAQVQDFVNKNMEGFDDMMAGVVEVRKSVFQSSMNRSIIFAMLGGIILLLFFKTSIPTYAGVAAIGLIMIIDIMGVARNYLNNEEEGTVGYRYWTETLQASYPIAAEPGDKHILEKETMNPAIKKAVDKGRAEGKAKANELEATGMIANRIEDAYAFAALNKVTDYRVFDYSGGFGSARTSYLHKSLGGYHGAKLRSIQNIYDFHLSRSNNKVFDILNVKYFLQPTEAGLDTTENKTAMGNGWLVKNVRVVPNANDEIRGLGSKFTVKNIGKGNLVVNGTATKEATIYGSENLQYAIAGQDTLRVPLSNGIPEGMTALFVMDAYGKTNLIPYSTQLADTLNSFNQMVELKVIKEFKPAEEVVMRASEAAKLKRRDYPGQGEVKLKMYSPQKLVYSVNADGDALAVFSEVYYGKGWTATIDGKPADILRVDYLLRGLEVPKGNHEVVFSFDIPKYHSLNKLSLIVSLITMLLFAGYGGWLVVKRMKAKETNG